VALCSLTTIIGYGSLVVADNQALRGFGILASLGKVACIAAALVALPPWFVPPVSRAREVAAAAVEAAASPEARDRAALAS
jgi:uncharacterized protein